VAERTAVATLAPEPAVRRTGRLTGTAEPKDALLRFAVDYFLASGARVRVEDDDVVSATLADGTSARYTTTLARARAEEHTDLLAEGSSTLASMLEETAARARALTLALPPMAPMGDATALALAALAEPIPGCGRCLGSPIAPDLRGVPSCTTCPLRDGRLVFVGLEGQRSAEISREWLGRGVELTFLVAGRNRLGRHDEWVRLAFEGEGDARLDSLTAAQIERAQPAERHTEDANRVSVALEAGREILAPALEASAVLLRQRTEGEYQRRCEETEATIRRMRAEEPDRARELDSQLKRELAALADVYAVEVEARLESACVIATPMVGVRVRGKLGGVMTLRVDLGRGAVLAPRCDVCGTESRTGSVCDHGHVLCPACEFACGSCGQRICGLCASEMLVACQTCGDAIGRPQVRPAPVEASGPSSDGALTVARLGTLLPGAWQECAAWLLECEGYQLEQPQKGQAPLYWHGRLNDEMVVASALRPPTGWLLDEDAVRRAAALTASFVSARAVLLSPATATLAATQEAARLGVRLYARPELEALLARLANAHQRAREQAHEAGQELATAAEGTRKALLAALKSLETAVGKPGKPRPALTRAAVAKAAADLSAVRQTTDRALLAWETLATDWLAAFDERTASDGALQFLSDIVRFDELRERGGHLREAAAQAIQQLQRTPAEGDLGYTLWRQSLVEELALHLEALRLRIWAIDPAQWQDFAAARNLEAEAAATRASTAAARAAARADQAYAQLAIRAGLST
jgi:hypothetical protein